MEFPKTSIKNPLTIIAIFAGIAEISGTAVLPLLDGEVQSIYIWFLMFFPILLVILFFLTLNFNHKTLYAPSDFKDEKHFLNILKPLSAVQKNEKVEIELREMAIGDTYKVTGKAGAIGPGAKTVKKDIIRSDIEAKSDYLIAEQAALSLVERDLGVPIQTHLGLIGKNASFAIDGMTETFSEVIAIQVKIIKSIKNAPKRIKEAINPVEIFAKELPQSVLGSKKLRVIMVIVAINKELEQKLKEEFVNSYYEGKLDLFIEYRFLNLDEIKGDPNNRLNKGLS